MTQTLTITEELSRGSERVPLRYSEPPTNRPKGPVKNIVWARAGIAATCLLVLVVLAHAGSASAVAVSTPRVVSGTDPLPPPTAVNACDSDPSAPRDWEQEPAFAVNPSNSANLVTAWIQDFSDAIVVGYSNDGGQTWTNTVPKTTQCTGGSPQYGRGSSGFDPWLSFGPTPGAAGSSSAYLSATLNSAATPRTFAFVVERSDDGGRSWTDPVTVAQVTDPLNIDGGNILADPAHPGRAYAVWREGDAKAQTRKQYLSRTDDGGATWSAPVPLPSSAGADVLSGQLPDVLSGQLHLLPDGTLIDVFAQFTAPPPGSTPTGPTTLYSTRSADGGVTWSQPKQIAVVDDSALINPGSAVAPDGTVYAAWEHANAGGTSYSILYSRSTDGGNTWQSPGVVATEPGPPEEIGTFALAAPAVSVAGDGTVAVAFYDHRNNPPGVYPPKTTDYWLRYSKNLGSSWRERHLAGPFDQTTAPNSFLGDYQGMAPVNGGFGLTFALAQPLATTPPTDIFYASAASQ